MGDQWQSKCIARRSFGHKLRCASFAPHSLVVRFKKVFITQGNDAESHFVDEQHISSLYPAISPDRASEIISECLVEQRDKILEKYINAIYNRRLQESYIGGDKPNAGALSIECTANLDADNRKYMHGKIVENALRGRLQQELGANIDLCKISPHIANQDLMHFSENIWPDDDG